MVAEQKSDTLQANSPPLSHRYAYRDQIGLDVSLNILTAV